MKYRVNQSSQLLMNEKTCLRKLCRNTDKTTENIIQYTSIWKKEGFFFVKTVSAHTSAKSKHVRGCPLLPPDGRKARAGFHI